MAERTILVCDVCGEPASNQVRLSVDGRNLLKDLCRKHLAEIVAGTHAPKRGRKPGSSNKSAGRGRTKAAKRTTAKRTSAKRSSAKRATTRRPRGAATESTVPS